MAKIHNIIGDVTNPQGEGIKVICHIVNDSNRMGSGVARALFEKWYEVKRKYHEFEAMDELKLGNIQIVGVEKDIFVVNMVAQHKIYPEEAVPLRYDALKSCLNAVRAHFPDETIHIPYMMGCDRAKGNWDSVSTMINTCLENDVFIYKLP